MLDLSFFNNILINTPAGAHGLLEFGFFLTVGITAGSLGINMNLLHHCTIELFVTVVVGGTLAILVTAFTFDNS